MLHNKRLFLFLAAFLLGGVFSTLPSIGFILTLQTSLGFSAGDLASYFAPFSIAAIISYLMSSMISSRLGEKKAFVVGMSIATIALLFLAGSSRLIDVDVLKEVLNLVFILSGVAVGLSIRSLQFYLSRLFPLEEPYGNFLLTIYFGLGACIAVALVSCGQMLHFWALGPLVIGLAAAAQALLTHYFLEEVPPAEILLEEEKKIKKREVSLWFFAGLIFLLGFCETLFGNWSLFYMYKQKGMTIISSLFVLSWFWASIVLGRIAILLLNNKIDYGRLYFILPWILVSGFFLAFWGNGIGFVLGITLGGIGCSAFFTLVQYRAEKSLQLHRGVVYDILLAAFMLGYACAAYGVGLMEPQGNALGSVFVMGAIAACCMGVLQIRLGMGGEK